MRRNEGGEKCGVDRGVGICQHEKGKERYNGSYLRKEKDEVARESL